MRLVIDKCMRERLLRLRETQLANTPWGGYIAGAEEAFGTPCVVLQYGMGSASLLGLNGAVIWYNSAEGQDPVAVIDIRYEARAIGWAARNYDLPFLLQLMPPMPPNGQVCPMCEGEGWHESEPEHEIRWYACMMCKGLTWVPGVTPAAAPSRSSAPGADCPAD